VSIIAEVGPSGHFFGTDHTMQRYERAFHAPMLSNWDNYPQWLEKGGVDATARAHLLWQQMLMEHEDPGLDPAIDEALADYVLRRKAEGGAPMN
jgi:trimethylamine--corrinoid protein Co-methyltransferase